MVNNIIKVLLLVVIVILAYLVFESVMKPVRFNKAVGTRSKAVIQIKKLFIPSVHFLNLS